MILALLNTASLPKFKGGFMNQGTQIVLDKAVLRNYRIYITVYG
jgi:hypothetical protein